MLKIITKHNPPPIPSRLHDWQAWLDGYEELGMETGPTEAEAITHLMEWLEVKDEDLHDELVAQLLREVA